MRVIRAPSIGWAHEQVVKMILDKGLWLTTEDAEATVEFEETALQVDTPLADPMVSPHARFQQKFVEQYAKDLLHGSHASFEYDYHGRLFDWGERYPLTGSRCMSTRLHTSLKNSAPPPLRDGRSRSPGTRSSMKN